MYKRIKLLFLCIILGLQTMAQSVAMQWNEAVLDAIRNDYARPNVHARNLFHTSAAMYDAWAAYDTLSKPMLLGKKMGNYTCTFYGVPKPGDIEKARETAISFAVYRLILHRFKVSPDWADTKKTIHDIMNRLALDTNYIDINYSNGNPAALGNYIAAEYIKMGFVDGSNEQNDYKNRYYKPINDPFFPELYKTPDLRDPNRWQQLGLKVFIDQSGNPISGDIPTFLGPEWGEVLPFALPASKLKIKKRSGFGWWVYHDPGKPPLIEEGTNSDSSEFFKWAFSLVSLYGSQLDPHDGVMWDISPKSIKYPEILPNSLAEFRQFYDFQSQNYFDGGYAINPKSGQPYAPNMVPRGDFTRVLAEFWADGPDSETPPGHWFTLLNYVNLNLPAQRKFKGKFDIQTELEWDVKSYVIMGGTMHDCAVAAWGVKGYYDFIRPISAIRYLSNLGQSSNVNLPNYSIDGLKLVPGFIELVSMSDSLVGDSYEHLNKVKLYTWKGHDFIDNPATDEAGVGWILAENWWPYQRPTFVTPPFAGYVSGHSTYSMAAATVLELITGDPYFPGGLGTYDVQKNEYLVFEEGPSVDFQLQWATYKDAACQSALSRIWGGIHPPIDDIPGRKMGVIIGRDAVNRAEWLFYIDKDGDGILNHVDCNDNDATIYHGAPELCDNKDNDCNGLIDDNIAYYTYFSDRDRDGFGSSKDSIRTCLYPVPKGYSLVAGDCDDENASIHPKAIDIPENFIDEDCSGMDSTTQWHFWPNPTHGIMTGYKWGLETGDVLITNSLGKQVIQESLVCENGFFKLDMSFLVPGIYWVTIRGQTGETFHYKAYRDNNL